MAGQFREYHLPCEALPDRAREALHPWLRQMIGLDAQHVRALLEARWSDLPYDFLTSVARRALEFQPKSLVVGEERAWLLTERPLPADYPPDHPRDLIAVPQPPEWTEIEAGLARFPFADVEPLRSFAAHFGALYDTTPDHAGGFDIPEVWESLDDRWGDSDEPLSPDFQEFRDAAISALFASLGMEEPETLRADLAKEGHGPDYEEWSHSLILYTSSCGDMVVMHSSGRIAWMCHDDMSVSYLADDFAGLLEFWVDYRRQPWPLEIGGPPSPDTYR